MYHNAAVMTVFKHSAGEREKKLVPWLLHVFTVSGNTALGDGEVPASTAQV